MAARGGRKRLAKIFFAVVIFICYIQFQLFSFTERRLFLKKMQLTLPLIIRGRRVTVPFQEACFKTKEQRKAFSDRSKGLTFMTWSSEYMEDLQSSIDFPLFPRYYATLQFGWNSSFQIQFANTSTGVWLFGSLVAPYTGGYRFALSASGEAILRLSRNEEPENRRIIASLPFSSNLPGPGQYDKYLTQGSVNVNLQQCQTYFIEVLLYNQQKTGHIDTAWETPNSLQYEPIPITYLDTYMTANDIKYISKKLPMFQDTLKMNSLLGRFAQEKKVGEKQLMEGWHRLPFMSLHHAFHSLPKCPFQMTGCSYGNQLRIPKQASEKLKVIDQYIKGLVTASKGKYSFKSMHSSEAKALEDGTATRYLLNLEFNDNMLEMSVRVSEFLFYDESRMELCTMNAFKWRRDAKITIVTVLRKVDTWSHYFANHLFDLTSQVRDSRLNVIVITSDDAKKYVEDIFELNSRTWHSHIELLGVHEERLETSESIMQVAVQQINDPKSIIFFTDDRVMLPTRILEDIRKRTIEGKTLFIPWPENFDESYKEGTAVLNPLSSVDHPPCFAVFVSDWKRVSPERSIGKQRAIDPEDWWRAVGQGALEIYVSKMSHMLYYPGESKKPLKEEREKPLESVIQLENTLKPVTEGQNPLELKRGKALKLATEPEHRLELIPENKRSLELVTETNEPLKSEIVKERPMEPATEWRKPLESKRGKPLKSSTEPKHILKSTPGSKKLPTESTGPFVTETKKPLFESKVEITKPTESVTERGIPLESVTERQNPLGSKRGKPLTLASEPKNLLESIPKNTQLLTESKEHFVTENKKPLESVTEMRKSLKPVSKKPTEPVTEIRKQLVSKTEKPTESVTKIRKVSATEIRKPLKLETEIRKPLNLETEIRKPLNLETEIRKPLNLETEIRKPLNLETEIRKPLNLETEIRKPLKLETEIRKPLESETVSKKPMGNGIEKRQPNMKSHAEKKQNKGDN